MDRRIHHATTLMKAEFKRPLTIHELARAVNLSPSHFRRLFKAETGQTPARYLKECRMAKARELTETTFFSVREIINHVGMGDDSHFVRDFERLYGLSPTRLRALLTRRGPRERPSTPPAGE
jgi:transcriptional regulator GlxA family with amidase domain